VKRANLEFALSTVGAKLWAALNSEQWRHREAAVSAFRDYLEAANETGVLPNKYKTPESKINLFLSAIAIAKVAITDKLLQIYLIGLRILELAIKDPICGSFIMPKLFTKEASQLTGPLLLKVEELNFKSHRDSQRALINLYKHQSMAEGESRLVEAVMEPFEKKGQKPDKLPERVVLGRLELMIYLAQMREQSKQQWDWKNVITLLATPSMLSQFPEVRQAACNLIAVFFHSLGDQVKGEFTRVAAQIGLRQKMQDLVFAKMAEPKESQKMLEGLNLAEGSEHFYSRGRMASRGSAAAFSLQDEESKENTKTPGFKKRGS